MIYSIIFGNFCREGRNEPYIGSDVSGTGGTGESVCKADNDKTVGMSSAKSTTLPAESAIDNQARALPQNTMIPLVESMTKKGEDT